MATVLPTCSCRCNGQGVAVFTNDGKGRFANTTADAGTATRFGAVTLALADADGDGDLDLYVANNRRDDYRDLPELQMLMVDGKLTVPERLRDRFLIDEKGGVQEYGEPDQLYTNDGRGKFTPVSWTDGAFLDEDGKPLARPPLDWGLTAQFRDMNGDGSPDLDVCNDYWTPDRCWINDGTGRFRAIDRLALRSISSSSMGVDFADVDRDGKVDFFVVDMMSRDHQRRKMQMGAMTPTPVAIGLVENRPQVMRNTFFRSRGDGTFAQIAYFSGLQASEWSWQPVFLDVDLDGYEDVLVTSGHARDVQDADKSNEIKQLQSEGKLTGAAGVKSQVFGKADVHTAELLAMSKLRPRLDTAVVAFRNKGDLTFAEQDWGTGRRAIRPRCSRTVRKRTRHPCLSVSRISRTARSKAPPSWALPRFPRPTPHPARSRSPMWMATANSTSSSADAACPENIPRPRPRASSCARRENSSLTKATPRFTRISGSSPAPSSAI